jgi:hypothetical protein
VKFIIETLVDITETQARRGADRLLVNQQANYNTIIQTAGLRVNPIPSQVSINEKDVTGMFGTAYKGIHRVWTIEIDYEYEGGIDIDMLTEDFDLVPVINNCAESISLDPSVIRSRDKKLQNIIFSLA